MQLKNQINYEKLGMRIKLIRKKKNLTQEQLSDKTDLSSNYLSKIERSLSIPSLETLLQICSALDVTPDYLLLDSIHISNAYIMDDIAEQLSKCNHKSLLTISKLINVIIEDQDEK